MFESLQSKNNFLRLVFVTIGAISIAWAASLLGAFERQERVTNVTAQILDGADYKPEVLDLLMNDVPTKKSIFQQSHLLSKLPIIVLRRTEQAIRSGRRDEIDSDLALLQSGLETALENAPSDSFLWLLLFWVENTRSGFEPKNLRLLKMSYELGPHEGWIAAKRSRLAFAIFPVLTSDLAELATSEFVNLVHSQFLTEAADLLLGPGWSVRHKLLAQLERFDKADHEKLLRVLQDRNVIDIPRANRDTDPFGRR